jgi:cbb3-type cytochrome oxidase subunit 3
MNDIMLMSLRAAITLSLFALFIALIVWAWSPKRRQQFTVAANLVFDETDRVPSERLPVERVPANQELR